jgi:hypothetical protein
MMLIIVNRPTMIPTTIDTRFDHSSKTTHEKPIVEAHAVNPVKPLLMAATVWSWVIVQDRY